MASQHPAPLTTECPNCGSYGIPVLEGLVLADHRAYLGEPYRTPREVERLCPGVTPELLFDVWLAMMEMEMATGSRWPAMHAPEEDRDD